MRWTVNVQMKKWDSRCSNSSLTLTADLFKKGKQHRFTAPKARQPQIPSDRRWCFGWLFMPGKYRLRQLRLHRCNSFGDWFGCINGAWSITFWHLKSEVWKYLPSWRLQWCRVWFGQTFLMQLLRQNKTACCETTQSMTNMIFWNSKTLKDRIYLYIHTIHIEDNHMRTHQPSSPRLST
jgi:hypothetical protein